MKLYANLRFFSVFINYHSRAWSIEYCRIWCCIWFQKVIALCLWLISWDKFGFFSSCFRSDRINFTVCSFLKNIFIGFINLLSVLYGFKQSLRYVFGLFLKDCFSWIKYCVYKDCQSPSWNCFWSFTSSDQPKGLCGKYNVRIWFCFLPIKFCYRINHKIFYY